VTGRPSLASKEKGEQLFSWMVEDLGALIRKGMLEEPPLPHSYHEKISVT
jgi:creatinine amidohydrolase